MAQLSREQREARDTLRWTGLGLLSFCVASGLFITFVPADPELLPQYAEVPSAAYLVPAVAFTTAFVLNLLKALADWGQAQAGFSVIACYIALVAALTDFLHLARLPPILKDSFGQGLHVLRLALWLWTTPAMVYLLGYISDLSSKEVLMYMTADALMVLACLVGLVQPSPAAGVVGIVLSCAFFVVTLYGIGKMFAAPLSTLSPGNSHTSLKALLAFTIVTWSAFVVVFFVFKLGYFSPSVEEWTWGLMDIVGKVMFSSGLLQSNFINIEERRRQAMKLVEEGRQKQVLEELTSLVRQKEQFMSSMSHELRTPLNGIIGLSDALLIGCCGELTEMSRKTISTVKSSGLRLLNLINDILDSTTMKHGKLVIRHDRVKLDRLVDDVLDLLKPLAKKSVTLVNDISSSMAPVAGDLGRIMQIFHHLIGNACKFTYNGTVTISAILKMDEVEVAVADTGIGIPREKFRSIFQPFEQVDPSSRREHTGTGFGLTLVKQLVEAHGGSVSLKSKVGVGTTIYITFKAWEPSAHSATMEKIMSPQDIQVTKERVSKMMSILKLRVGDVAAPRVAPEPPPAAPAPVTPVAVRAADLAEVAPAGSRSPGVRSLPRRARSMGMVLGRDDNMLAPDEEPPIAATPPPQQLRASYERPSQQREAAQAPQATEAVVAGAGQTPNTSPQTSDKPHLQRQALLLPEAEELPPSTPTTRRSSTERRTRPSADVPRSGLALAANNTSGGQQQQQQPGLPKQEPPISSTPAGASPAAAESALVAGEATGAFTRRDSASAPGAVGAAGRTVGFALEPSSEAQQNGRDDGATAAGKGGEIAAQGEVMTHEEHKANEAQAPQPAQPIHVLSVDDDPVNQMVVETWLSAEGMTVTQAMDGEEALKALQGMERLPDIILLDVMMPGMSGYEVCRSLRELYPSACVPVIMLSAKGKEEDVVEGLAVGANDYVVKPFGRKELLARIQAHLRYRASAMQAAATEVSHAESDRPSHMSESFMETLCTASNAFSLPPSIKSKVENSTGVSAPLQVFDDLTMLVVGVTNVDALTASRNPSLPELLGSLTSLYICLEDLLLQHNAYLVDCLEDRLVIVLGLSSTTVQEQARDALDLAEELNRLVITLMPTANGSSRLLLSAGIHCCTAMAAIVGVKHPVLHVTGALSDKAMQLQGTCPPGCIHVSKRVVEASSRAEEFVQGVMLPSSSEATFLHRSGPWSAHQTTMAQRFERYMAAHPFGPIDSSALRLRPVQRALLSLLQADVGWLVEILSTGERQNRRVGQSQASAGQPADGEGKVIVSASNNQQARTAAAAEGLKLVTKLQLDKEDLLRELEHKASEADRLQVVVDNLQLDLYGLEALQQQLDASVSELGKLRGQLAAMEVQAHSHGAAAGPTALTQARAAPPPQRTFDAPAPQSMPSAPAGRANGSGQASTASSLQIAEDLLRRDRAPPPRISEFLASLGMGQLAPVFEREEITPDMLPYIHDATLLQLGVTSVGDLVRLRRAAASL